jgi:sporulation protein YlmC with PRC-barrel domain
MKSKLSIILGAATASALSLSAMAQPAAVMGPDPAQQTAVLQMVAERDVLLKSTAQVSDVIGLPVESLQHVPLGRVKNLALDLRSGRIVEVVIESSGLTGPGGPLTAVPPGAVHPDATLKTLQLTISPEQFAAAPRFDAAHWAGETQSNRVTQAYTYFGEQPYFVTGWSGDGYQTTNRNGSSTGLGDRTVAHVEDRELARVTNNPNNTISIVKPDGLTSRDYYSDDESANKLMGISLRNQQGDKLGKVENIIVDLKAGRIAAVIIRSDRYLWTGGMLHAVPATELRLNKDHNSLLLNVGRVEFSQSPHFDISQWPNYPLPGYGAGIYSPYKIEPYNNDDAPRREVNVQ